MDDFRELVSQVLTILVKSCPKLLANCYWAGSSAISIEELSHRQSYDLDFHTCDALIDVRPFLAEIKRAFPKVTEIVAAPAGLSAGFRVSVQLDQGQEMLIEVLSNFDDVSKEDLSEAKIVKGVKRVSLNKYLRDKLQCLCERTEARDLADIFAVLQKFPKLVNFAHQCLLQIDLVLLSQRLLDWNDEALKSDLLKYNDIKFDEVKAMRDKMLAWIKEIS
jgi:hypothetical protein